VPLYVLVKHATAEQRDAERGGRRAAAGRACPSAGPITATATISRHAAYLGKRHAVERLLPRLRAAHGDLPVLGIGDSLTDAPFMAACDFAMMPVGSQLRQVLRGG
jgi:3-deoxy-D-manno-octulosonate 8-phosphate phosphatase KdsC-like HAD superfamily phosphatase